MMTRHLIVTLAGGLAAGAVIASEPGDRAENRSLASPVVERLDTHLEALRERLPHDGFTIVVERPFVVVGDEPPHVVRRRAERTVRWAVDLLKKDFFQNDPDHFIDVWLFKDRASYEKHVEELWGEKPGTPYGYYSPRNRALVMNIATGGGTLVHEIVHPFMEANFPACPAWFNEGLGSLYEQCHEVDGEIRGLVNWRLSGLQRAIREDRLPTFETLCGMSQRAFYSASRGDNYAQARYLLYYLQEQGLLRRYYREFTANATQDPSGYATLQRVLDEPDMAAFQARWEKYVMGLGGEG